MNRINLGGYSRVTSYEIIQHSYAATERSYIALLEILQPPIYKDPFVVICFDPYVKYLFCEVPTKELGEKAFNAGSMPNAELSWQKLGIKRIYKTSDPMIEPWFYSLDQHLFGVSNEFTTEEKLILNDSIYPEGKKFLVFTGNTCMRFDTVAGILKDKTIVWNSGNSDRSYQSSQMFDAASPNWCSYNLEKNWRNFLTKGTGQLVFDFPIYCLNLTLSAEDRSIWGSIDIEEEFKGIRKSERFLIYKHQLPKEYLTLSPIKTFAPLIEFLLQKRN